VLALVEGHLCDPLQKIGAVLQRADNAEVISSVATPKWSPIDDLSRVSMASISLFFATKAAIYTSFDFLVFF
jgi:hypothetical protein